MPWLQSHSVLALCAMAFSMVLISGCGPKTPCEINPGSRDCKCFTNPSDSACVDAMGVAVFHHVRHFNSTKGQGLRECVTCHEVDPDDNFNTLRPGRNDHTPCKKCHATFFTDAARPDNGAEAQIARRFCKTCHTGEAEGNAVGALGEYPRPRRERRALLITEFSHQKHLGRGLQCGSCHKIESAEATYATMPRHDTCATCHGNMTTRGMSQCNGCHGDKPQAIRALSYAKNQIVFTHGSHIKGPHGPIECNACHTGMAESDSGADHALPSVKACVTCHNDPDQVPEAGRMTNCSVCHQTEVDPATMPDDHK